MCVWVGPHEAVEDRLGFPTVDGETCSLEPSKALSILSDEAGMYQMIGGAPCQDIPVIYVHV